ncbi:MAG: hypothetical protein RLN62_05380 [Rickettsiales bacterium]
MRQLSFKFIFIEMFYQKGFIENEFEAYFGAGAEKDFINELSVPSSGLRNLIYVSQARDGAVNILSTIKKNLNLIRKSLKNGYYNHRDQDDDREFLDGEAAEWSFYEVSYLFVRAFSAFDKILKSDPEDLVKAFRDHADNPAAPIRKFGSFFHRANVIDKTFNDEKVHEKIYEWAAYQYKVSGEKSVEFCSFLSELINGAYEFFGNSFSALFTEPNVKTVIEEDSEEVNFSEVLGQCANVTAYSKEAFGYNIEDLLYNNEDISLHGELVPELVSE